MKYSLTCQEILDKNASLKKLSKNQPLVERVQDKFFEAGASFGKSVNPHKRIEKGLQQLQFDFLERQFKCNGNAKLGLSQADISRAKQADVEQAVAFKKAKKIDAFNIDQDKDKEVKKLLQEALMQQFGEDNVRKMILANGQGAPGIIPFIAAGAIPSAFTDGEFVVKSPKNADINYYLDQETKKVFCRYYCDYFDVEFVGGVAGYIQGPIEAQFGLVQKGEAWGFELMSVSTDSEFIVQAFQGKTFTVEEARQLKDFNMHPNYAVVLLDEACQNYQRYLLTLLSVKNNLDKKLDPAEYTEQVLGQKPKKGEIEVLNKFLSLNNLRDVLKSEKTSLEKIQLFNEVLAEKPQLFSAQKDPQLRAFLKKIAHVFASILHVVGKAIFSHAKGQATFWKKPSSLEPVPTGVKRQIDQIKRHIESDSEVTQTNKRSKS